MDENNTKSLGSRKIDDQLNKSSSNRFGKRRLNNVIILIIVTIVIVISIVAVSIYYNKTKTDDRPTEEVEITDEYLLNLEPTTFEDKVASLNSAGQYEEAEALIADELDSAENDNDRLYLVYMTQANTYASQGRNLEAIDALDRALGVNSDEIGFIYTYKAQLYEEAGDKEKALETIDEVLTLSSKGEAVIRGDTVMAMKERLSE